MSREQENRGFTCEYCGKQVEPLSNGSYRNHCPFCLYSKHVDIIPGDRAQACDGLMEPIRIRHHSNKGYQIIHKCLRCGEIKVNRVAQDTIQPDDFDVLVKLNS